MGGWRPMRLAGRPIARRAAGRAPSCCCAAAAHRLASGLCTRGPIGQLDDPACVRALLAALRSLAGSGTNRDGPRRSRGAARLRLRERPASMRHGAPRRRSSRRRPGSSTWHRGEEALKANLKRKHRQYVNKAERAGVTIERFDGVDRRPTSSVRRWRTSIGSTSSPRSAPGSSRARRSTTSASGRSSPRPAACA